MGIKGSRMCRVLVEQRFLVACLVLAACSGTSLDSGSPGPRPAVAPTTPSHHDALPVTALHWRARTISASEITVDLVDGSEPTEGEGARQHFIVQRFADGVAALRVGPDMTLAWWRASFGDRGLSFGSEMAATVCGHPATRQEVLVPAEAATGIVAAPSGGVGGHIDHRVPAQVHVAVGGTTADGTPFVVTWAVAADRRDAHRADEDHVLGSVRCSSEPAARELPAR